MTESSRHRGMKPVALILLLAATVAGCGRHEPAPQVSELPVDRTFLSTEVREGDAAKPLVDETRIRMTFRPDGMQLQAGCNHLFAQAPRIIGGRLVVNGVGGTEMGCEPPLAAQDEWLTAFVQSKPKWRLDGDVLTLTSDEAQIELTDRRVAEPDLPLTGTRWVLDTIIDGDTASSLPAGARAHVEFDGKRVKGHDGCNAFSAAYTVEGENLRFGRIQATLRGCRGDEGAVEDAVFAVLQGTPRFEIEANRLTLKLPASQGLSFTAD